MTRLIEQAGRGAIWLFVRFLGRQVGNSAAFFVIAAHISPESFGAASLATAIVISLRPLLMRGIRDAVLQEMEPNDVLEDTAFWLNFAFGCVLTVAVIFLGELAAILFDYTELATLISASAFILIFSGFSAVQEARIERAFRHRNLAISQAISTSIASVVAIILVLRGAQGWSLVSFYVIEAALVAVSTAVISRWLPGFRFSVNVCRDLVSFSMPLAASFTLTSGTLRFAQIAVGIFGGLQAAAHFRVASQVAQLLGQLVSTPLSQILLPAFARSKGNLRTSYVRALVIVSAISFPLFLGAAAVSPSLVPTILGAEWAPAGLIASLLCFSVFAAVALQVLNPMLLAASRSRVVAVVSLLSAALAVVTTSVGSVWGPEGAGVGYAIHGLVLLPISVLLAHRICSASPSSQVAAILSFALPAFLVYAVVLTFLRQFEYAPGDVGGLATIFAGILVGSLLYLIVVRFILPVVSRGTYSIIVELAPEALRRYL